MTGPPKMRLPYAGTTPLRLVATEPQTQEKEQSIEKWYRGIAYAPQQWVNDSNLVTDALIGGFEMSVDRGQSLPLQDDKPAYIWDSQGDGVLAENQCELVDCSLNDLTIEPVVGGVVLAITPSFTFSYKTLAYAAQLGEIRLVTTNRFVTDIEGAQHSLIDTSDADGPVLYLEDHHDSLLVRQQRPWQCRDTQQEYGFDYRVQQGLLREWQGVPVQSVTVLEQYTSYFMQRAVALMPNESLWVPAYAPISWGWSLRVEWEHNDWVITRRKLVIPVVGHDGWQLPEWCGNTLNYTQD